MSNLLAYRSESENEEKTCQVLFWASFDLDEPLVRSNNQDYGPNGCFMTIVKETVGVVFNKDIKNILQEILDLGVVNMLEKVSLN